MSSAFGQILVVIDELTRRAAVLPSASPADLSLIAGRLDEAAQKVRVIAMCREVDVPTSPRRAIPQGRAA
ncbi:hypothetical protein [uncultured Enterovirga sp.]|uniref:hypothetical protein n=1 Tax=uncultured Enterovirga sp. TaxID=2026352 RepID=UPI0035CAB122